MLISCFLLPVSGMEDISCGLEKTPIPCEFDETSAHCLLPDKFRYVRRSIPGPGCIRELFEEQLCGCDCLHGCHQDSCSCLTRFGPNYHPTTGQLTSEAVTSPSLKPIIECNSQCACDASCPNRLVQHGPGVKLKVDAASSRGFGLFACEDIQQLTFVCEYAGEVVGLLEARRRMQTKGGGMNYLIVLREHGSSGVVLTCVDPKRVGNVGRFANHSCDPNMLMVPVRVDNGVPKLALFARRNICAGEELTFDYSGESVLNEVSTSVKPQSSEQRLFFDEAIFVASKSDATGSVENQVELNVAENISDKCENPTQSMGTGENVDCCTASPNMPQRADSTDSDLCSRSVNYSHKSEASSVSEAVTVVMNERKRKLTCSKEDSDCGDPCCDKELSEKRVVVAEVERSQTTLKACLCGATKCKGFLPFDSHIFE